MKKLLLLFSLLISNIVYSQNYYTGSTAKGTTVIYKCYPWTYNRIIIANNLACSRIIAQPLCKNGQEAAPGYGKMARINDVDFSILKSVFKDTLSAGKLAELKEKRTSLLIPIVIEPAGRITEVGFTIPNDSPLSAISPDEYYRIEQQIKSKIWFTLDEYTRDTYQWISEIIWIDFENLE